MAAILHRLSTCCTYQAPTNPKCQSAVDAFQLMGASEALLEHAAYHDELNNSRLTSTDGLERHFAILTTRHLADCALSTFIDIQKEDAGLAVYFDAKNAEYYATVNETVVNIVWEALESVPFALLMGDPTGSPGKWVPHPMTSPQKGESKLIWKLFSTKDSDEAPWQVQIDDSSELKAPKRRSQFYLHTTSWKHADSIVDGIDLWASAKRTDFSCPGAFELSPTYADARRSIARVAQAQKTERVAIVMYSVNDKRLRKFEHFSFVERKDRGACGEFAVACRLHMRQMYERFLSRQTRSEVQWIEGWQLANPREATSRRERPRRTARPDGSLVHRLSLRERRAVQFFDKALYGVEFIDPLVTRAIMRAKLGADGYERWIQAILDEPLQTTEEVAVHISP
jgi:hypothetical protein